MREDEEDFNRIGDFKRKRDTFHEWRDYYVKLWRRSLAKHLTRCTTERRLRTSLRCDMHEPTPVTMALIHDA